MNSKRVGKAFVLFMAHLSFFLGVVKSTSAGAWKGPKELIAAFDISTSGARNQACRWFIREKNNLKWMVYKGKPLKWMVYKGKPLKWMVL